MLLTSPLPVPYQQVIVTNFQFSLNLNFKDVSTISCHTGLTYLLACLEKSKQ